MTDSPGDRLRSAAAAIEDQVAAAAPGPWTYYEDHGRGPVVGVLDADGRVVLYDALLPERDRQRREHGAALTVLLSATVGPLVAALRAAAMDYDGEGATSVESSHLLDVADAVLEGRRPYRLSPVQRDD